MLRGDETRSRPSNGVSVNMLIVSHQNSYYNRAPTIFNILPSNICGADITIGRFKFYLLNYCHKMTKLVFDIDDSQTFKTACVKCHSCRPLSSLADKMCWS